MTYRYYVVCRTKLSEYTAYEIDIVGAVGHATETSTIIKYLDGEAPSSLGEGYSEAEINQIILNDPGWLQLA